MISYLLRCYLDFGLSMFGRGSQTDGRKVPRRSAGARSAGSEWMSKGARACCSGQDDRCLARLVSGLPSLSGLFMVYCNGSMYSAL